MSKYILFFLITSGGHAWAQFDDGADKRPTTQKIKAPEVEVTSSDLKALKEALNGKKESEIINAASIILAKDESNLFALNNLAVFHFSKRRKGLSKIIINRALEKHGNEPVLHNNLGVIHLSEGDYRKAMLSFNKALALEESYKPSKANLGLIYLRYGGFEQAEDALKAGYRLVKSDLGRGSSFASSVVNNYALSLVANKKGSKAQSLFEDIIDSGSRDPMIYLNYAILLIEVLNKKEKAVKIVSKLKFLTDDRKILKRVSQLDRKLDE